MWFSLVSTWRITMNNMEGSGLTAQLTVARKQTAPGITRDSRVIARWEVEPWKNHRKKSWKNLVPEKDKIELQNPRSGWWFGTLILFVHIFGIIIPTDFHIFQMDWYTTNQQMNSTLKSQRNRSWFSCPFRPRWARRSATWCSSLKAREEELPVAWQGWKYPVFFWPENDGNQCEKYDVQIVLSIGGPIIFRLTHISEMFMGYL